MPRLPTIVDDQQIIAQAGLLTDQPAGIREDDPGSILIVPEKTKAVPAGESGYRKLGGLSANLSVIGKVRFARHSGIIRAAGGSLSIHNSFVGVVRSRAFFINCAKEC